MRYLICAFFMLNLVWAKQHPAPSAPPSPAKTINIIKDLSKPLLIRAVDAEFAVSLPSNVSTGYKWFVKPYATEFVQVVKHAYQAAKTERVGAKGEDVWFFKLQAQAFQVPTVVEINFLYWRPWEKREIRRKTLTLLTAVE